MAQNAALYDRVVIMESGVDPRRLNFVHRVMGAGEVVRGVWCPGPIDLEDQVSAPDRDDQCSIRFKASWARV
jgi:hypothetical protein